MKEGLIKILLAIVSVTFLITIYNALPETIKLEQNPVLIFENDRLKVSKLGVIDRVTALYVKNGIIYGFGDHYLYKSTDSGMSFEQLGKLPKFDPSILTQLKDFIARLKIIREIRRVRGPKVITVLDSGTIIVFYDQIYRSEDNGKTFQVIGLPTKDFAIPFTNEIAVTPTGNIYVGEYSTKKRPNEVRILRGSDDGKNWSVAYTFPSGKIFHVHSVFWSKQRNSLLIATGDRTGEVYLFESRDEFETLSLIGSGDQGWRIVSLSEKGDLVFWGSDNDQTGAHIYTMKDGQRQQHDFIGKVSYDATKILPGTLVISETLEPVSPYVRSSNTPFELGIWFSDDGNNWVKAINMALSNREELLKTKNRPRFILPTGDGSISNLLISPYKVSNPQSCQEPCTQLYEVQWKDQ